MNKIRSTLFQPKVLERIKGEDARRFVIQRIKTQLAKFTVEKYLPDLSEDERAMVVSQGLLIYNHRN